MPDTPLSALKRLSPQAREALRKVRIITLESAAALTDEELEGIKGFGRSSIARIRSWQQGKPEPEPAVDRTSKLWEAFRLHRASGCEPSEAMDLARIDVETFEEGIADG
jgi:hypothetical protein